MRTFLKLLKSNKTNWGQDCGKELFSKSFRKSRQMKKITSNDGIAGNGSFKWSASG